MPSDRLTRVWVQNSQRWTLEIDQVYGIARHRGFRSKSVTVFGGMVLRAHGVPDKDTVTLIK